MGVGSAAGAKGIGTAPNELMTAAAPPSAWDAVDSGAEVEVVLDSDDGEVGLEEGALVQAVTTAARATTDRAQETRCA